ncbi:hypothetical protein ABW20_dc0106250 [Dactylellina cionopaga]|nr:hypothetical protein ABW20_dc0106250 [Dactylellina cionopaga]
MPSVSIVISVISMVSVVAPIVIESIVSMPKVPSASASSSTTASTTTSSISILLGVVMMIMAWLLVGVAAEGRTVWAGASPSEFDVEVEVVAPTMEAICLPVGNTYSIVVDYKLRFEGKEDVIAVEVVGAQMLEEGVDIGLVGEEEEAGSGKLEEGLGYCRTEFDVKGEDTKERRVTSMTRLRGTAVAAVTREVVDGHRSSSSLHDLGHGLKPPGC